MFFRDVALAVGLASLVVASPTEYSKRATPKVYLAGDSTMALGGGGSGTQGKFLESITFWHHLEFGNWSLIVLGWGPYFPYSTKNIEVINKAIGGRSARSYTNEGRFQAIIDVVQSGDWVGNVSSINTWQSRLIR